MSSDSKMINPYRPTSATGSPVAEIESLVSSELDSESNIAISGVINDRDLEEYLTLTTIRGSKWILIFPIIFGALIVLMNASWPWIMCAVGLALLFLVMVSLLSRSYRRSEFLTVNRQWDRPFEGNVTHRGYEIRSDTVAATVLWAHVSNAQSNENVVVFQSTQIPYAARIIPRHTVASDEDWERLRSICDAIHCTEQEKTTLQVRTRRAAALVKAAERETIVPSPEDAISFAGPITGEDLQQHGSRARHTRTILRAVFYLAVALVGISAIFTGLLGLMLLGTDYRIDPTPTLLVVTVTIFSAVAIWIWIGYRRQTKQSYLVCFQKGFATSAGVTVDYGTFALHWSWDQMFVSLQSDSGLVLAQLERQDFVTLRRDMFAGEHDWHRLQSIVEEKTNQMSFDQERR